MFDHTRLKDNQSFLRKVRHYILGMADARAELLQQEVDMASSEQVGPALTDRIDLLEEARIELGEDPSLYVPVSRWIKAITDLDGEFRFLSEPDCLINMATRAAAVTMCDNYITDYNYGLENKDLEPKDCTYLLEQIKVQNQIRHAVLYYRAWIK